MDQTSTLSLSIDATSAKRGSDQFKAAIEAVKASVRDLERDSSGVFTTLRKNLAAPTNSSGVKAAISDARQITSENAKAQTAAERSAAMIQRVQNGVAMALNTSSNAAQRLQLRLNNLGDTAGLAQLDAQMQKLKADLAAAETPLDVATARASFASGTGAIQRGAGDAEEQARAIRSLVAVEQAQSAELTSLALKYNPLRVTSEAYARTLAEIETAERAGVLSSALASAAREKAASALLAEGEAATAASVGLTRIQQMEAAHLGRTALFTLTSGVDPVQMLTMESGRIATFLTMGESVSSTLSTIGAMLTTALTSPIALAVAGFGALGTAILAANGPAVTFESALKSLNSSLAETAQIVNRSADMSALRAEYGAVTADVKSLIAAQKELAIQDSQKALDTARSSLVAQTDAQISRSPFQSQAGGNGGFAGTSYDRVTQLRNALTLTSEQATKLDSLMAQLNTAKGADAQVAAFTALRDLMSSVTNNFTNLSPKQKAFVDSLLSGEDSARKLAALMADTGTTTAKASGAASAMASNIGTAADSALRLVQNLGNVPASLGLLGKSVSDQIATMTAENAALTLQVQKGYSAAAAARQVQLDTLLADSKGHPSAGLADQAAAMQSQIDQLNKLGDAQKALQKQLSAENRTGKGGIPTPSQLDLRSQKEFVKSLHDQTLELQAQALAQDMLANHTYKTQDAANAAAKAFLLFGANVSDATKNAIKNLDDLTAAANNPVKQWESSVPTWQQATQKITAEGLDSLSSALSSLMQGEKVGVMDLVRSLEKSFDDMVAKMAVKSMVDILFGDSSRANNSGSGNSGGYLNGGGGGGLLGGLLSGLGGHLSNLLTTGSWLEGGLSTAPVASSLVPASAFRNAPHFAEGGVTGGGIPAVLHPNEAVIPLSRGRSIPVELNEGAGAGTYINAPQNITILTSDADSFRRSKTQVAAQMAAAGQQALRQNG